MSGSSWISEPGTGLRDRAALFPLGIGLTVAGGSVALVGLLGLAGSLSGLGAMIAGAFLTAPRADRLDAPIGGWWRGMVAGTMVALCGQALALLSPPLGGLLLGAGCIGAIVAAALGPGGP